LQRGRQHEAAAFADPPLVIEPNAHEMLASTAITAGTSGIAPLVLGCSSSASPANPSSMPTTAMRDGRSPPQANAMIAIHTGASESSSEFSPVGKYCTVHAVVPLPSSNSVVPVTAARTRSSRVIRAFPRSAHTA
jgi:hypothetical protein